RPDVQALPDDLRDPELRARATAWRAGVEAMLTLRLGGGQKAREAAAVLFAAWQGQALWGAEADEGFRLKDVAKRLG
ncbi:MAG: transcriptional regulator, partial [Tabrizicola sp.]|nr:transcriptional regulator [Tabrizicola sp.]